MSSLRKDLESGPPGSNIHTAFAVPALGHVLSRHICCTCLHCKYTHSLTTVPTLQHQLGRTAHMSEQCTFLPSAQHIDRNNGYLPHHPAPTFDLEAQDEIRTAAGTERNFHARSTVCILPLFDRFMLLTTLQGQHRRYLPDGDSISVPDLSRSHLSVVFRFHCVLRVTATIQNYWLTLHVS